MSIQERISRMRENSSNWRTRVQNNSFEEQIPSVNIIRQSLFDSQESWRKRVEGKDVTNFTPTGRLRQLKKQKLQRSFTLHVTSTSGNGSPEPHPDALLLEQTISCPQRLPAVPIVRATSKENRPAPRKYNVEARSNDFSLTALNEVPKHVVSVPKVLDDPLIDFFTSDLIETDDYGHVQLPEKPEQQKRQRGEELDTKYKQIADARRAVRPERRKPSKAPNPLKSLAQRSDLRSEYEEIRSSSATFRTPTPSSNLLRTIDPSSRLSFEAAQRRSMLADSVIAGLSSTADFSNAKNSLRQVSEAQPSPLTGYQRQLQPYKQVMLLHVKGRRHVQVRLVAPTADSMNSGDCFVLVTPTAVFAWFGALANVVETNRARELAQWIQKHHELNYRGCSAQDVQTGSEGYIAVHEQMDDDEDLSTMDIVEAGLTKKRRGIADRATVEFWEALGYASPPPIHSFGSPEEDELYETLIQHTNRVYEVTVDQLVPCMQYWGTSLKRSLLSSNKAFVFDFGSEVYLWTGTQVSPEVRLAGVELVQQAYTIPYDYSSCRLNPLSPLSTNPNIPISASTRPEWTLVGKITEKGETVLFKQKFIDWSDISQAQWQPGRLKLQGNKTSDTNSYTVIEPYPADQLYESAFTEAPPPPHLLTLEGRFVGRGGQGCRCEDGIMRRFTVESGPLRVWHISEFSRTELPADSHGQFHQGDTYVIRWPFRVMYVGLRDIPSRSSNTSKEQCVYFFWQGSQSKITEQGASAVMTIELDEERCPQIRVTEGKEPPAFCRLFEGRMAVYAGKRSTSSSSNQVPILDSPRVRLFLVRGEAPLEGYLLEVPAQLSSLRSQGVFLVVQYMHGTGSESSHQFGLIVQKAWLWCGYGASETSKSIGRHIIERFKDNCPKELALELRHVIEVTQTEEKLGPGELVFLLNAEDRATASLCFHPNPNQGPLVIWQLTAQSGCAVQANRLSYTLQPDPSMLAGPTSGKLPLPAGLVQTDTDGKTNDLEPLAIAKAVAERLRASNDAANAQQKHFAAQSGFPFLLNELYAANQPALFLVLDGRQAVYLWQGWWPIKRRSRELSGPHVRSSSASRCSSFIGDDSPGFTTHEVERGDVGSQTVDPIETLSPGSSRSRFYAFRLAALKSARELAAKLDIRASVVYAGLEPSEFLALFPPYVRTPELTSLYQHEEGKTDGQLDSVDDLLESNKANNYTLSDLQQRPLPPELDATCLEIYLDKEAFANAFSMDRKEFDQLPKWKQVELKKNLGLF